MNHKFETVIVNCMIGFLFLSLVAIGVRLFAKEILADRLGMDNRALQAVADYTWGDVMEKKMPDTPQEPSEELGAIKNIYEEVRAAAEDKADTGQIKGEEKTTKAATGRALDALVGKVHTAEDKLENYCTQKYAGYYVFNGVNRMFDRLVQWKAVYARENGAEFFLKNGVAYNATTSSDMAGKAEHIMEVATIAGQNGAEFLYVQPPYRTSGNEDEVPWGAAVYENENADVLLERLKQNEIKCLDLREAMSELGWSADGGFFVHDGHWTVESSLVATQAIAQALNNVSGFSYEPEKFEAQQFEERQYSTNNIEAQEQVAMLFPKAETDILFVDGYRGTEYRGSYQDACLDQEMLADERSSALTIYSANRIRNSYLCSIYNRGEVKNRKKILILSNSFSWYIASFLALDTSEVVYSYYYDNAEAAEKIIQEMKPDEVLVMY